MSKITKRVALAASLWVAGTLAFAAAPVEDATQPVSTSATRGAVDNAAPEQPTTTSREDAKPSVALPMSSGTVSGNPNIIRLQRQMSNMINMNLPQQITQLQQEIAQLRGQLEVQAHDIQLLNKQQRRFYQDLDSRINQLKNLNSGGGSNNAPNSKVDNNVMTPGADDINLKDANAYQAAFTLLTKHKYDKAKQGMQSYLTDYPNGKYVADATYWMGEIYLAQKDYKNAEQQFNAVIKSYGKSAKVPDAKLKIAIIHLIKGNVAQARKELLQIKKQYPNSTAAQLANIRLQQMDAQKSN